jgi:hypothetical protein
MEAALYYDIAKRYITPEENGRNYVREMSSLLLVQLSRDKKDESIEHGKLEYDIDIYDIYGQIATAKLETQYFNFIDYFHLGKINGKWQIVNIIWVYKDQEK